MSANGWANAIRAAASNSNNIKAKRGGIMFIKRIGEVRPQPNRLRTPEFSGQCFPNPLKDFARDSNSTPAIPASASADGSGTAVN